MSRSAHVAVVQAAAPAFALDAAVAELERRVEQAAGRGAELIVFPEAFVGGYPKGLDFGARVGRRTQDGRADFARYHAGAVDVPGPACERILAAARRAGVDLVVGVIERDGGTLYCTALTISRAGVLLARHRKVMPTAMERLIWGFGDGSTLDVVDTALGRVGAVICWENYMPLLRATMYRKGVQLYCAPTVDDRESWIPTMRHVAIEGRCFVLSACQFARRGDYPADYDDGLDPDPARIVVRGGSCIVDPFGTVLAGPTYDQEAVLDVTIDLDRIVEGKYDLDVVGHYARPDIFELVVDERPRPGVSRRPSAE